jgi:cilia- and flagella-associated protein 43
MPKSKHLLRLKTTARAYTVLSGIIVLIRENKMVDFQAEDLVVKTRDIQLLRVTKQMQEFIRSGDEHKHAAEVQSLEKNADYSDKVLQSYF